MNSVDDIGWSLVGTRNISDYKIVQGLPSTVEVEINSLIRQGWQPYGVMYKLQTINRIDIVVQCIVLYETSKNKV